MLLQYQTQYQTQSHTQAQTQAQTFHVLTNYISLKSQAMLHKFVLKHSIPV